MNLSKFGKVTRVSNAVAAGTGTTNCTAVDMKGFDAVTFYALMGSVVDSPTNTTITIKAQQSSDNGVSDAFTDLTGTAVTFSASDDNKVAILEVTQPRERYIRLVIVRANGNGVIDGVIAVQTSADSEPVTQSSSVVSTEHHLAPSEGTA